jgi:hypothetical protein
MTLCRVIAALLFWCNAVVASDEPNAGILLKQTIPLPGVEGRIDHLDVDISGQRLFVCALGNNTVEVVDLKKGERVHTISGLGNAPGCCFCSRAESPVRRK